MYEDEELKKKDIIINKTYRKELLNDYIIRNNCILITLDAIKNISDYDKQSEYRIADIIENVNVESNDRYSVLQRYYDEVIVIKKVN